MTDEHDDKTSADDRNSGEIAGRDSKGRFAPGNPGRPHGTRHRATKAAEDLIDGEADRLTRKAIDLALGGDTTALRLCLERIAPPRKDTPVSFDLPVIESASQASEAAQAVLSAVSAGEITPLEGTAVMGLVEQYRRCLETSEFEARIAALEARK